ncbi:hypothetical protein GALMADRAFT_217485 [Galerina marginata CBS 339.88]|uniref:Uncharacterized protein n=1 Tax=Galerina marginata (strain CBS 339.88) TaxID=685588 RepID=A0A067S424_GALM3|nr:hypothetical protein GALMADRAFT_217485 [Galerina marginata CBS 339.88]
MDGIHLQHVQNRSRSSESHWSIEKRYKPASLLNSSRYRYANPNSLDITCTRRSTRSTNTSVARPSTISIIRSRGYHYPQLGSSRKLRQYKLVLNRNEPNAFPLIDLSTTFANLNGVVILKTKVLIQKFQYLFISYFDPAVDINVSLLEICPQAPWRGELVLFSIGRRNTFLTRTVGSLEIQNRAISQYLIRVKESMACGQDGPTLVMVE